MKVQLRADGATISRRPPPKVPGPDLWSQLDALNAEPRDGDIPPSLGFTVIEFAERYKLSRRTASERVKEYRTAGKIKLLGNRNRERVYDIA